MPLAPLRRVSRCLHRHKCIRWTLWALLIPVLYAIIVVPVFFIYQGESNSHEVYVNRLPIMANMQRLEQRASRTNMTLTQLVANKDPLIEESNDFIDILFRATTADFRNKMLKMQVILTPVGSYSLENSTNMIGHSLSGVAANLNAGDDDIFNVTAHAFLATPVTVVLGNTVVKFPAGQPMESREIQLPFLSGDQGQYPIDRYPASLYVEVYQEPANATTTSTRLPVPFHAQFSGAVQSIHFRAFVIRDGITNASFYICASRTLTTIVFSIFVCILLWLLTLVLGVYWVQLVVCGREILPTHLSVGTAILFAMPNIRNSQPGIPSVGVSSDMLGYVWNIMLVTVFTVSIILTYTLRWLGANKKGKKDSNNNNNNKAQVEAVPSMGAVTSFPPLIEPISAVDPPFQSKSQRSPK